MLNFFKELSHRNPPLFYFGTLCWLFALLLLIPLYTSKTQVLGINAWIKPIKFFLSSAIFAWSMAWFLAYLPASIQINIYTWVVILVLAFELIYISVQASLGQLSHFNISTSFHSTMFGLMGLAISIMTLWTGYIALLFFVEPVSLPAPYLWGIRLGLLVFVIFAFQGGIMGSKLAHTVGASDGGEGYAFVNWSKRHGDLRIAHFLGMHALQILPFCAYYLFKDSRSVIGFSAIYFLLVSFSLIQALLGKPLLSIFLK